MGHCQQVFQYWHSLDDVISFAFSLQDSHREAFLVVVCAICWLIWTLRNNVTFHIVSGITNRNLIILIYSLIQYWAGNFSLEVKRMLKFWMSESLDMIPLQALPPVMILI
jgi:hypothetical protein